MRHLSARVLLLNKHIDMYTFCHQYGAVLLIGIVYNYDTNL